MRAFIAGAYDAQGRPLTAAEYPEAVRELYGAERAHAVLAEYPLSGFPTPSLALATLLTDEGRMLGACAQLPAAEAAAQRAPVFVFEFAQPADAAIGDFPLGAHHGADIPYFFDSRFPGAKPRAFADPQKAFADKLTGYWTTFAHTGNPSPDWPAYQDGIALFMAVDRTAPIDLASEHRCDFWQALP
jgi:para-nitrobenzyl esterase